MNPPHDEIVQESPIGRLGALGFALSFVVLGGLLGMTIWVGVAESRAADSVSHTREVQSQLTLLLSTLQDAETGQRGYLLTGLDEYLEPYESAERTIDGVAAELRSLTADNPRQQEQLDVIEPFITEKFDELGETISLLTSDGVDAALDVVTTGRGKIVLDTIRALVVSMQAEEDGLLEVRQDATSRLRALNLATQGVGIVLVVLIAVLIVRNASHNVAVRRRAETALIRRSQDLETANSELEAFSYSVSHDLRAPLRSMGGFSQALIEDYGDQLDGEAQDYLQRIGASSRQMGQMIDDILALSRSTRQELTREKVDLSAYVEAIIGDLRNRDPDRRVTVEIEPNLTVWGDARLLRSVLDNLLNNAWKFTSKKDGARIEFGASSMGNERVYFLRDNGAGFDMAYVDKLFGIFQRLHAATDFEGNGVGLATVVRLVGRHGGRVWAEGEANKGATFYFTIDS
jgi:CHASE3 domain sensor protein